MMWTPREGGREDAAATHDRLPQFQSAIIVFLPGFETLAFQFNSWGNEKPKFSWIFVAWIMKNDILRS